VVFDFRKTLKKQNRRAPIEIILGMTIPALPSKVALYGAIDLRAEMAE
jgi:hypothetical protein